MLAPTKYFPVHLNEISARYSLEEIYDMFGGRLPPDLRRDVHRIGDDFLKCLAKALAKMLRRIVELASYNIPFVSSTEEFACCIPRERQNQTKKIEMRKGCS